MTTTQTSLLATSHSDLITSLSYNLHGNRLATSSLDHTLRVTGLSPHSGLWDNQPQHFRAHDTAVIKVVWAHPQFGNILASGSVDGIVKVWLEGNATTTSASHVSLPAAKSAPTPAPHSKKWTLTSTITDCTGTIRDLEFAPAEFGLKLAVVSSDSHLRVWECLEPVGLSEWSLIEDIDLASLPNGPSSALSNTNNAIPLSSNVSTAAGLEQTSSSYGSNQPGSPVKFGSHSLAAHGESLHHSSHSRVGMVESDGGWSLSWCKEAWWGERLAVSSGTNGIIRLFHLPDRGSWTNYLNLLPPRALSHSASPISSLAWSPSSGRSFQLLASGSRDGHARVWKLYTPSLGSSHEMNEGEWRAEMDSELLEETTAASKVGNGGIGEVQVDWNSTGTVLSTAGDDGKIRLWKSTYTLQWRVIAVLSTEEDVNNVEGMMTD